MKSKLMRSVTGIKSNSSIDALFVAPAANPIADSKSASPGQSEVPSEIVPVSGPTAFIISPEVIIIPLSNGQEEPLASK